MGLVKIQSISDIITNSSSEVFCIKVTDNFRNAFKGFEKYFTAIFLTEQDIKDYLIKAEAWNIESDIEESPLMEGFYSPLSDYNVLDVCNQIGKTKEEIVDFFYPAYKHLLGYAIYSCEDTYDWDKLNNYIKENKDRDGEDIMYAHS